jgi:AcrR family transcriptional regulator
METRSQATAATRRRLLDAALEVLAEVGADALTMQAVAERADVALRTLYNHVGSKEELMLEAFGGQLDEFRAAVRDVPGAGELPRERLHAFVDVFLRTYERQGPVTGIFLRVQGVPELDAMVTEMRMWRRTQLVSILEPAADRCELRTSLEEAVALAFAATALGTWAALRSEGEGQLEPEPALALVHHTLDAALFR